MSVRKFRSIEAMSAAREEQGGDLAARLRALWARSSVLLPAWDRPAGVFKFRGVEEMQRQREGWERRRARAGRGRSDGPREG